MPIKKTLTSLKILIIRIHNSLCNNLITNLNRIYIQFHGPFDMIWLQNLVNVVSYFII